MVCREDESEFGDYGRDFRNSLKDYAAITSYKICHKTDNHVSLGLGDIATAG